MTQHAEIVRAIAEIMANEDRFLRDRLYEVLAGPMLAIGPPWPDDTPALFELEAQLRELQRSTGRTNIGEMLKASTVEQLEDLAVSVGRIVEELAGTAE